MLWWSLKMILGGNEFWAMWRCDPNCIRIGFIIWFTQIHLIESIMYIKTIQTYATWHSLKPLIATCIPLNPRVLCLGAKTKACKP
ncbi:hypothetical protein Hdeb2414_s0007g00250301 [Helianthus debilis subsp. tardiflorus]